MTSGLGTTWLLFGLIFFAANLPWFSNKLFYIVPVKHTPKNLGWCLFELIVLYFLIGGVALYAEFATFGQIAHQDWEFYAITACMFIVFAFPGFVYKVLWK
ncbi:hypothetical protein GALL_252420 [mine drainage metagenome]|uniref:DUF2818 family protein n=1 Tax=mine drainage metagenome TaxID=410659 RepID=A0A1J5R9R7_9ZZZZ